MDTAQVNIDVQYTPTLSVIPSPSRVIESSRLTIDCSSYTTVGNPSTTSYMWTYKGSTVSSGAVLDINSISESQAGQYTCTATNTLTPTGGSQQQGTDTAQVNVDVQYSPSISGLPSVKTVTESSRLQIDCSSYTTVGNPSTTSYAWTYKGSTVSSGAVLDINSISRSQSGQYNCTATNTLTPTGESQHQGTGTAQVNVDVQYGPGSSVTVDPAGFPERVEGTGPFIASCKAMCNPSCSIAWKKGSTGLPPGQISISNISRTDQGIYTCQAQNGIGGPQQKTFTLTVYYLDRPGLTLDKSNVTENDAVKLDCNVESNPTVEMTIKNIDNDTVLVQRDTNNLPFTIERVQCLHNGMYVCSADNKKTETQSNALSSLNVQCSPRHDYRKNITHMVAKEINETANMVADVIANPMPRFTWWRYGRYGNDQLVPISNFTIHSVHSTDLQSVLQVNVSHSNDFGKYAVQVENSVDTTLMVFELTAKSSPFPPFGFEVIVAGPKSASSKWTSNFNGGAKQLFFLEYQSHNSAWKNYSAVGIQDPGRDRAVTVNITTVLEPDTKYVFKLYSVNIYGVSDTMITSITTAKALITASEANIGPAIAGGVVAALVIIAIVVVIVVVLLYRKRVLDNKASTTQPNRNTEPSPTNIALSDTPSRSEQTRNPYSGLNYSDHDRQNYAELRTYQNLQSTDVKTTVYENLQDTAPQTYERLMIPTYENTVNRNKGQTVTLEGSTSAVHGNSHQFTCAVTGGSLGLALNFVRGTRLAADTPCVVRTGTPCREHTSDDGYSCSCVSGQTRKFFLTIASVSLEDDDVWTCQYSGVVSNNIRLDVYYPPTITSVPSNKDVTENTSPNINCSSNITPGNPSSTSYRWTGPGGYSTTGTVLDRTLTRTQGGQYTCTATNTAGLSDTAQVNINIQYPPIITSVPSNKDVTENTSPNIDCSSNITPGKPSSTSYRWTGPGGYSKTGAVLDRTVTRTQGGQYTCTATNTVGLSDTTQVNVNVQYPPTITSVPSNKDVTENTSPNIDCSSNITPGNPSSTSYRWTGPDGYSKTGAVLDRTVTRTQAGQYTCTANNTAGLSDTEPVNINVQYSPIITSVPSNKDVTENTSPNIDCSSNITPGKPSSTSYRWTGLGSYSKTGAILDRTVTRTQGGQYTCTAINTVGLSDTAQVNVNVQYPPTITSVPSNKNVTENTSPDIDCSSNITPGKPSSTSYRWTGPGGYSKTGAVLDRTVTRTQGRQYTCTATNTAGLSDTAQVNINVQYRPGSSVNITPASPDTVTEGSGPLTIACSADCNPVCGLTFRKGGSTVSQGQVILTNVNRSHAGNYICEAGNGIGSTSSRTFTLIVQYLDYPTMTISPPEVMENASVQLDCRVSSNPTAQMTIRNVDNNTNLVDKEMANSHQYVIERAQCLHNGTYQCVVNNRGIPGTELTVTLLSVLCSPRHDYRKNITRMVTKAINGTANIVADVIANPLPRFTWWRYVNDQLVYISNYTIHTVHSTDLQSVLQINVSHSRDYGKYAVQMTNSVATTLMVFELTAKSSPYPQSDFDAVAIGSKSVTLSWVSNFNGGAEQTFFLEFRTFESPWKNSLDTGIVDPGRDKHVSVNITTLESSTKYYFSLYSTNIYGSSDKVTTNITTLEEAKVKEPEANIAGAVAGGVVSAMIVIIIVVVIIIVYKRGMFRTKESRLGNNRNIEQMTSNEVHSPANETDQPKNPYSGLDFSSPGTQTYTDLRTYTNIQTKPAEVITGDYENLKDETPQSYENIEMPTHAYENSAVKNKEPVYQNTQLPKNIS